MPILSSLIGTLANTATVILGSLLGMLIGKGLPERLSRALMFAIGLSTVYIGVSGCIKGQNTLVIILSLIIGTLIGEGVDLDKHINRLGKWAENACNRGGGNLTIAEGFVNASLLFCVGAMTIVGSLNSGLTGDHTMLYAKACLDFISATIFASTMGLGVMLSAVVVLVLQGGIALSAHLIAPLLTDAIINEMTCIGSVLILGLALNLLGVTKLKMMNFVPAIFLPLLLCPLYDLILSLIG